MKIFNISMFMSSAYRTFVLFYFADPAHHVNVRNGKDKGKLFYIFISFSCFFSIFSRTFKESPKKIFNRDL